MVDVCLCTTGYGEFRLRFWSYRRCYCRCKTLSRRFKNSAYRNLHSSMILLSRDKVQVEFGGGWLPRLGKRRLPKLSSLLSYTYNPRDKTLRQLDFSSGYQSSVTGVKWSTFMKKVLRNTCWCSSFLEKQYAFYVLLLFSLIVTIKRFFFSFCNHAIW